ncbi:hypothetical protein H5410_010260 [Solanum commersonii]|uniref:Uncharacterized protein n=1 Tax=Solanum commersonii TaxID=4109 RepID=A0A9J6ALS5_SOLCO|nr:hypothetical protein H5410_010260 [Solanum commersonii]
MVALDSLGKLLHAHGSPIQYVGKSGLLKQMLLGKLLNVLSVKIGRDSLMQQKLSSMLNHAESLYIPRCLNTIADSLARFYLFVEGNLLNSGGCMGRLESRRPKYRTGRRGSSTASKQLLCQAFCAENGTWVVFNGNRSWASGPSAFRGDLGFYC